MARDQDPSQKTPSRRGFAAMDKERQREIARKGGASVPDEKRSFEHGTMHIVKIDGATIGRAVFNPGWKWSKDVKPLVGTASCEAAHTGYVLSGRLHVKMDDGAEGDAGPGDAVVISVAIGAAAYRPR